MSEHNCAGIRGVGNSVVACQCLSVEMLNKVMDFVRLDIIREIQAFANDYHHHIEGRDVVIVEQLLTFLRPVEGQESNE